MLDILRLVFDRRHVKDMRNWVLIILFASFGVYHKFVIMPIHERLDRHGKKIRNIIKVARLADKMEALDKSNDGLP